MPIVGAWTKARLYVGGCDFTGDVNSIKLDETVEMLDATVFGSGSKIFVPGIRNIALASSGFINTAVAEQDDQVRGNFTLNDVPVTLMMTNTPAEGDPCLFFRSLEASYQRGGQHGQIAKFDIGAFAGDGGYPLIRGTVLNPGTTAVTATGNTTGTNVPGAVGATQFAYALIHVTAVSAGDSIVVTIQSDDNGGFSSPTTRFTFASKAAIGAEYLARLAGPITDTYWRAVHTLTGAGISIKYACAVGIGPA